MIETVQSSEPSKLWLLGRRVVATPLRRPTHFEMSGQKGKYSRLWRYLAGQGRKQGTRGHGVLTSIFLRMTHLPLVKRK